MFNNQNRINRITAKKKYIFKKGNTTIRWKVDKHKNTVKFVQGNVVKIKDCMLLLPVVSTCGVYLLFLYNLKWTLKQTPRVALASINYTLQPLDVSIAQVEILFI